MRKQSLKLEFEQRRNSVRDMIFRYREDPVLFVTNILGYEPFWYNQPFLRSMSTRRVYRSARQTGKTNTIAAALCHFALFPDRYVRITPDMHSIDVVIVSNRLDQAQILYGRFASMVEQSRWLSGHVINKTNIECSMRPITTPKKVKIFAIALGEKGVGGRGASPSLILVDEYSHISDAKLAPLLPAGAARDASWWISSTPNGQQGRFYDIVSTSHLEPGATPIDGVYSEDIEESPWTQFAAKAEWCPLITKSYLADLKAQLTPEMYKQETEAAFIGTGSYLYPRQAIIEAIENDKIDESKMTRWDISVDVSRTGKDETVYMVLNHDGRRGIFTHVEAEGKSNSVGIANKVEKINREQCEGKCSYVRLETNGVGAGAADILSIERHMAVAGIHVNQNIKVDMHTNAERLLNTQSISLHKICKSIRHPLIEQLQEIQQVEAGDTGQKIIGGRFDDYPAAFALACLAMRASGITSLTPLTTKKGKAYPFATKRNRFMQPIASPLLTGLRGYH